MPQIQTQSVGLGSTANINALNRLYGNPVTAQLVNGQSLKSYVQTPSPLANARYSVQQTRGSYQTKPISSLAHASSGVELQRPPAMARYGSALGGISSPLAVMGEAAFRQKVIADADARQQALSQTSDGRETLRQQALRREYIQKYYGDNFLLYPAMPLTDQETQQTLHDFEKVKAAEQYNDRLQKAIDAYQSKPENRRKLYDELAAKGEITPPDGYKSDELDRYRKQYGTEKNVGDIKPYDDLTPDYSNLKPDISFHPDGTVSYDKPNPNSSNIPLVLAPGQPQPPPDLNQVGPNNQFARRVKITFYSPNNRITVTQNVENFEMFPSPYGVGIRWDGNESGPLVDPSTLTVSPIDGSSIVPTNRTTPPPANQEIPTNPDGTADLKPFNPTTQDPTNSRQSAPQHSPSPTASPKLSPVGKVDSPQTPQSSLPLEAIAPLLAGLPLLSPLLAPKGSPFPSPVPSTGVGESNPVKATSINPGTTTGTGTGTTTPPMVDVPTTGNPTKVDNKAAGKSQEQLGNKATTDPKAEPKSARKCEDPCMQSLHEQAQGADSILKKIAATVGVDSFPVRAQLLSDSGAVGMTAYNNLAELAIWNTKNVDAVTGLFPLEIPIVDENGKETNVKIESVSHAFYELFSLLKVIAEDADAAVNVGSRAVIEAIQSKISARQAGEYAKGNAKFLGYLGQGKQREIKLTVTPAAAGFDNKLQNQEIAEFLQPSTQTYVGWECLEKVSLLPIVQRTLEDGEIARSALFQPLKEGKKPEQSTIPGTSIKYDKKHIKAQEKAWEAFKEDLKREGKIIDDKQGQKDVKS